MAATSATSSASCIQAARSCRLQSASRCQQRRLCRAWRSIGGRAKYFSVDGRRSWVRQSASSEGADDSISQWPWIPARRPDRQQETLLAASTSAPDPPHPGPFDPCGRRLAGPPMRRIRGRAGFTGVACCRVRGAANQSEGQRGRTRGRGDKLPSSSSAGSFRLIQPASLSLSATTTALACALPALLALPLAAPCPPRRR